MASGKKAGKGVSSECTFDSMEQWVSRLEKARLETYRWAPVRHGVYQRRSLPYSFAIGLRDPRARGSGMLLEEQTDAEAPSKPQRSGKDLPFTDLVTPWCL